MKNAVLSDDKIFVKSHVARDLLQNAAFFKTDKAVVWEYVSNGLQYVDPGTNPVVKVILDGGRKRIAVADNGRGMDWAGLRNFFIMHGENLDRREGKPGRGRFGTGKSAAFGIADLLRITTVRNGRRCRLELMRADIEAMNSEDPIPVRIVEKEVRTSEPNGTVVEIEGIHLKSLDQAGVIQYVERHLARWPKNAVVFVNNHECEFAEPPVAWERRFRPEGDLARLLGDVDLIVKVSKVPLDEESRGIAVYANGVWHETTLAGCEGREMAQYIFGAIDVARLDEDKAPIAPFDSSRSLQLNPSNELVQAIYAFLGQKVEEIRRQLLEAEKKRKASEEAKKLAEQAAEIARVINEDFDAFRQKLLKAKAKAVGGVDTYQTAGESEGNGNMLFGGELPAEIVPPTPSPGPNPGPGPKPPEVQPGSPEDKKQAHRTGEGQPKHKPRGGFSIEFKNMGAESFRALYVREERVIHINLEHPQLAAARGSVSDKDPTFRRLAYEVAFSEYAVALASELASNEQYLDPSEPIFDIRETINRLARRGAILYVE